MAETILFIFEGQKTEVKLYEKMNQLYFSTCKNTKIISTYNTNIYNLWFELKNDEFLDIVELIREKNDKNRNSLQGIGRDDISQIYLFFDHDGHDPKASDEKIESMLELYREETDSGKLYISYPIVLLLITSGAMVRNPLPFKCFGSYFFCRNSKQRNFQVGLQRHQRLLRQDDGNLQTTVL